MTAELPAAAKRGGLVLKVIGFGVLFVVSFVFFLVMTFPYEVLKETLAAELSQATGYTIRIGALRATLPVGVSAKDVRVETRSGGVITLGSVEVDISLLNLLIGKAKVEAAIGMGKGEVETDIEFSLLDLVRQNFIPQRVSMTSSAFPLDEFATFGLKAAAGAPGAQMAGPLLAAIGFTGKLNGNMDFRLDTKVPTQSTGQAELKIMDAQLKLSDPAIGLPDQIFTVALIKARVSSGDVVIDPTSAFISDELQLTAEGKIQLKPDPFMSRLEVKVGVSLDKGLKEKFGWIMDAMTGTAAGGGKLSVHVRGTMAAPNVTTSI